MRGQLTTGPPQSGVVMLLDLAGFEQPQTSGLSNSSCTASTDMRRTMRRLGFLLDSRGWQVHAVVEHTQHVDEQWYRFRGDAVQQKVPPSSTVARHVKYSDSWSDVGAFAGSRDLGSFRQLFDGGFQDLSVSARLLRSEMLGRPAQDVPVVGFGRSGEANPPAATVDHPSPLSESRSATASVAKPFR